MQEINISRRIEELNIDNIDQIRELYEDFKQKSTTDYNFDIQPLEYEDFKAVVQEGPISGYILYEDSTPKGFLLYVFESHKAVELNIIHLIDNENSSQRRAELTKALLEKYKDRNDWSVISYPMLGVQEEFIREIALLGFKLIGQAIVKFKFDNVISLKIIENLTLPELPEGYSVDSWKDEYFEGASQSIHETFRTASDANFDPRFLTVDGSKEIVSRIITNVFGLFMPDSTFVIKYNNEVVGVCFANITGALTANVPLIGVKKEHKNKGFGKYLLKHSVDAIIASIRENRAYATEVNAAVETDNFAALRMYRKIGFKEDSTYSHAYIKNQ